MAGHLLPTRLPLLQARIAISAPPSQGAGPCATGSHGSSAAPTAPSIAACAELHRRPAAADRGRRIVLLIQTGRLNGFISGRGTAAEATSAGRHRRHPADRVGLHRNAQNNVHPAAMSPTSATASAAESSCCSSCWLLRHQLQGTITSAAAHMPGSIFNPDKINQSLGENTRAIRRSPGVPDDRQLRCQEPRGDVAISGTSDDNEIHIAIHKQVTPAPTPMPTTAPSSSVPNQTSADTFTSTSRSLDGAIADPTITFPADAGLPSCEPRRRPSQLRQSPRQRHRQPRRRQFRAIDRPGYHAYQ